MMIIGKSGVIWHDSLGDSFRNGRDQYFSLMIFTESKKPWLMLALTAMLTIIVACLDIYHGGGTYWENEVTVESAWFMLAVSTLMLLFSVRHLLLRRKNPPPPPDPDEEAAKAKAELDAMYFREHGKYPEEADEGKEARNGVEAGSNGKCIHMAGTDK